MHKSAIGAINYFGNDSYALLKQRIKSRERQSFILEKRSWFTIQPCMHMSWGDCCISNEWEEQVFPWIMKLCHYHQLDVKRRYSPTNNIKNKN